MATTESKMQGCFLGVMIGDAMGMPVEMMTPEKILEMTEGKGIEGFVEPIQRKLADTQGLKAGSTTDDWQLTAAVAESLLRCDGFNLNDMALAHVEAYETSTSGWGTTTRVGMEQLKEYFDSRGKSGRRPGIHPPTVVNSRGQVSGCGNGVAMKAAPMGIWEFVYCYDPMRELGFLTHPDPRAGTAAHAIARVIGDNIAGSDFGIKGIYYACRDYEHGGDDSYGFSERLKVLFDDDLLYGPIERLREVVGTNCMALESVCFAIAVYFRNRDDFRAGVLEAVNSGGDADSTASMAGAMIGARVGIEGIPAEWIEFNPEFEKAKELGSRFRFSGIHSYLVD